MINKSNSKKPKKIVAYNPAKIESKWQKYWLSKKTFEVKNVAKGEKKMVLVEFPYPSGAGLHMGHMRPFIAGDVTAKYFKMNGFNTMYPMGWDAFGLPAENYAIKNKVHPRVSTAKNVANAKKQLLSWGTGYDWSREVNTTDPEYYKWTQKLFLEFYDAGLAYEKFGEINWCPKDKTGLANEEVIDGKCARCDAIVEKKNLRQWYLKITDYAEKLLEGLKDLKEWPEPIKLQQENWIGKSEGAEIDFRIELQNKKPRFVIIHGYTGSSTKNFIPWLKRELEAKGYEVETPELPNTNNPKESEQVEYVLTHCKLDENTVIIGHSLGAVVAMKAIMKLNKTISGLVLAGAALDPKFHNAKSRPFWENFSWDYDYEKVKKLAQGRIAVLSDLKEKHRVSYLKFLSEKLESALIEVEAVREHFCATEEPSILKSVTPEVTVFTTRPDTLFGVTYLVLAPEHPWTQELANQIENKSEVEKYINDCKNKSDIDRTSDSKEKTGVELKGVFAINPANNEKIPVWIADYVLASYGTGVVMAVPAHDERDFEFAKKYNLPIRSVVAEVFGDKTQNHVERNRVCAIIINQGKVLCEKTNPDSTKYPGKFILIGGGIESGEDPDTALKRELFEELGITDKDYKVKWKMRTYRFSFYSERRKQFRTQLQYPYVIEVNTSAIIENPKEAELIWVDENEAKQKFTEWGHLDQASMLLRWKFYDSEIFIYDGELINSAEFSGLQSDAARIKMAQKFGRIVTKYKLRDWVFSRQRYWGEPIPLIHCAKCGTVPVPEKDLPVKLPEVKNYEPTGTGESPLAGIDKWVNVKCPKCKGKAKRETNTMPQWAGSSWYWLRYMDPKNKKTFAEKKVQKYWSPVDLYFGGMEHTTLHLLYSRFWNLFFYDRGLVTVKEPYKKRVPHGIILGPDGEKMSKSRGNVVNPDDVIKIYGADTTRLYMMFLGPHGAQVSWNDKGIVGTRRFLERVFAMREMISKTETLDVTIALHKAIKKVTEDIETFSFNTAVSTMMIFVNTVYESKEITKKTFETFLQLLAPFAPHLSEELWNDLGNKKSIYESKWPKYKEEFLKSEKVVVVVQVNGKIKAELSLDRDLDDKVAEKMALENVKVVESLVGQEIKRVIVVKNRLINIVI